MHSFKGFCALGRSFLPIAVNYAQAGHCRGGTGFVHLTVLYTNNSCCCPMPPKLLQFCIFCTLYFYVFVFPICLYLLTGFVQLTVLFINNRPLSNTSSIYQCQHHQSCHCFVFLYFCIFVFLYFCIFLLILYSTMLVFNGSSIYRCHRHQSCHLCSQKRPPPLNRSGDKMDYRSFIRALKFQNRTRPSADGLLCCRPKLFLAFCPPVG